MLTLLLSIKTDQLNQNNIRKTEKLNLIVSVSNFKRCISYKTKTKNKHTFKTNFVEFFENDIQLCLGILC